MSQPSRRLSLAPLVFGLILLLVLAVFIRYRAAPIEPITAAAPESVFSAGRAFSMLEQLTREQVPHSVDTPANRVVEQRLIDLLREMGYQEEIQDAHRKARGGENLHRNCDLSRNIL